MTHKNKLILIIASVFIIGFALGQLIPVGMGWHNYGKRGMHWSDKMGMDKPRGKISGDMQWKIYSFSGVDFKYPADWTLTPTMYTTPAGASGQVGFEITPSFSQKPEDRIAVGGRQVICAMFSNDHIKCAEPVKGVPIYTNSDVPDIIAVYNQMVASSAKTTAQ